jgi:hypothetical protein
VFRPIPLWVFLQNSFAANDIEKGSLPNHLTEQQLLNPSSLFQELANPTTFLKIIKILFSSKSWNEIVSELNISTELTNHSVELNFNRKSSSSQYLSKLNDLLKRHSTNEINQDSSLRDKQMNSKALKSGKMD